MSLPHLTAVFVGGQAFRLAEALRKVAGGGKSHQLADLRQAVTGVAQHIFALLNAAAVQVGDGRNAVRLLEGVGQVVFVDVGDLGKGIKGDILPVVVVQIPLDLHAFPVVRAGGFLHLQREGGAPYQPDEQDFQQVLADGLAAVQTAVCLSQQHVQQRYHPLPVLPAVEDGVGGIGFAKQDLDARNAQYDVFQRRGVQAQFGVLHLRVDDDHIVRFDREQLPAEQKLPLAAEAVKQLRAGMGVDRAVPVAAESALADVQQPEGFPWSGSVADIKALGTHKRLLLKQTQKI